MEATTKEEFLRSCNEEEIERIIETQSLSKFFEKGKQLFGKEGKGWIRAAFGVGPREYFRIRQQLEILKHYNCLFSERGEPLGHIKSLLRNAWGIGNERTLNKNLDAAREHLEAEERRRLEQDAAEAEERRRHEEETAEAEEEAEKKRQKEDTPSAKEPNKRPRSSIGSLSPNPPPSPLRSQPKRLSPPTPPRSMKKKFGRLLHKMTPKKLRRRPPDSAGLEASVDNSDRSSDNNKETEEPSSSSNEGSAARRNMDISSSSGDAHPSDTEQNQLPSLREEAEQEVSRWVKENGPEPSVLDDGKLGHKAVTNAVRNLAINACGKIMKLRPGPMDDTKLMALQEVQKIRSSLEELCNLVPELVPTPLDGASPASRENATTAQIREVARIEDATLNLFANSQKKVQPTSQLTKLSNKSGQLDRAQEALSKQKYNGDRLEGILIAAGVAVLPKGSLKKDEHFIALNRAAMCASLGITVYPDAIAKTAPSSKTLKNLVAQLAAEILFTNMSKAERAVYIFFAGDKGHKNGLGIFVKTIAYWDPEKGKVEYFLLDLYTAGDSDEEAAAAIKHSLKAANFPHLIFTGQCTDNGGGGVTEGLHGALEKEELTNADFYFISSCTLHSLNLCLAVPTEKVLGLGGLGKYNGMQMFHSIYDIQNYLGQDQFKTYMADALDNLKAKYPDQEFEICFMNMSVPDKKMKVPTTTRWLWLNDSLDTIFENFDMYTQLANDLADGYSSTTYLGIVASSLVPMLQEEELYLDMLFLRSYSSSFIHPGFVMLQKAGEHSKMPGFRSEDILGQVFFMERQLDDLRKGGWKTDPNYKEFVEQLFRDRNQPDPNPLRQWKFKEEDEEEYRKKMEAFKKGPKVLLKKLQPMIKNEKNLRKVSWEGGTYLTVYFHSFFFFFSFHGGLSVCSQTLSHFSRFFSFLVVSST